MAKIHPGFSLSQLIETTANELRMVRDKHKDDPVIQFAGCELELAVKVGVEAGGGIKFWLVDLSTKGSGETVSKVKLNFGPVDGSVIAAAAKDKDEKGPPASR